MNSRSLALATVTLLVGVGIGLLLKDAPEPQSPGAPPQAGQGAAHSREVHESASALMASPGAGFTTASKREKTRALAVGRPAPGVGDTPQIDIALADSRRGEPRQPEYHDDTFGPDEPGLPYPEFVDEDGARDDFERYGDGPVPQSRSEVAEDTTTASRTLDTDEGFEQSCQPAFSPCRRDVDCCGSAVCRSRPGTISGFFECTAD